MYFEEHETKEDVKRKKVVSIGGEAFVECLGKFGPRETLNFLVKMSAKGDWVAEELLYMFPTIVSWAGAIKKMTCLEIDTEFLAKKILEDPDWLRKQGIL